MWILILLLVLIATVIVLLKNNKSNGSKAKYIKKKPLSEIEQVVYWKIKEACKDEFEVLSQVAFSSFIRTTGEKKASNSKFYKARQKVADFVICNKSFDIVAIIEVDDKTHNAEKDKVRDEITGEAGIKTLRYNVKNLPNTEQLKEALK